MIEATTRSPAQSVFRKFAVCMTWFEGFGIVPRGQGIVADVISAMGSVPPAVSGWISPFNIAGDEFDPAA